MTDDFAVKVTPTQSVILDSLAARARLGEGLYTFDARLSGSLRSLERKGLVTLMSGSVEHSIRAFLTREGRAHAMSDTYSSPLEQEVQSLKARNEGLLAELRIALDRIEARA